jgi:hypothetical protein
LSLCTLADCEDDVLTRRRELPRQREFAPMVQNVVGIDREEKTLIEKEQRRKICTIGPRMYARGLVVAAQGNLSVRLDAERIIVTPSGACKGHLASEDLLVTDVNGNVLSGKRRPSSEMQMHLLCLLHRILCHRFVRAPSQPSVERGNKSGRQNAN